MNLNARQLQITELVHSDGELSVDRLAERFGVSGMTIRRDLQALAEEGKIVRTHGGAVATQQVSFEFQFLSRVRENEPAKHAIATAAAELVREGESVMLDSGTTTLALAQQLRQRQSLTVITTSLPIAAALQDRGQIQVLLLGGYLRRGTPDLAGALTESNLEGLRADVAFVGADGIDLKGVVYNESLEIARMLTRMVTAAKRVYVVADASKLGRTALARFGEAQRWQGLITAGEADRNVYQSLRRAGVAVMRADQSNGVG
ncbi:MAG: DeoR/GlpR transcriptional regulator [Phycisphaerales bacterium]|nr:DeoR/GlpR transcriptional regulator [Phycisphaerales bacterium]